MDIRLSPSRLNTYRDCARCFWLEVNEGVKQPSGPFPSLPSGVDKVIRDYFTPHRENGTLPPELAQHNPDLQLFPDTTFLEKARNYWDEPSYTHASGVVLRGAVDDLVQTSDGEIAVLDYKTRGYPPKDGVPDYYWHQINMYTYLLQENGYDTADYGLLLYFYPDKMSDGDLIFHNAVKTVDVDMGEAENLLQEAVDTLQGPLPGHDPDCDFCTWNKTDHREHIQNT